MNRKEKKSNTKRIVTGLVALAILVGLGRYIADRNSDKTNGGNVLGLQVMTTPTPQVNQSFQTVTVSMTGQQLTNWIQQMMNSSWPVSNLQATVQNSQIQINGQSTSNLVPGAFIGTLQKANNTNDVVAVTKVTRGGNPVSAVSLAVINTSVNDAIKKYLQDNNLTMTNLNISNDQVTMDLTGPGDKLNQVMNGVEGSPNVTPGS